MSSFEKSFVEKCGQLGIQEWVVCPGARNITLLTQLSQAQGLRLWTHFDERSAGFFALGRIQATGKPVAVITTSGTAVAELLPSVIEAHYQGRPLIIVSADREPQFRGSGAPQAIEQLGIFGNYVATSTDFDSNEILPDSLAPKNWYGDLPLHFNVCLPEPTLNESVVPFSLSIADTLPEAPFKENVGLLARFLQDDCWGGLVVLLGGLEPEDQDPVLWLLQQLQVPVLADATSGIKEALGPFALTDGDRLLKQNPPAAILRIGDIPTGRFWRDLETLPQVKVFSLTRTGYAGLAKRPSTVIKGSMERIIRALGDVYPVEDINSILPEGRKRAGLIAELLLEFPESEQSLIQGFSLFAAMGDLIYLGNSMPIRQWNIVAHPQIETANIRANRGANGIDGQIATFLGASADEQTSWGLFGDLTAMYDANAPALAQQLPPGKRIAAVINNKGGHIFDRLPGGTNMSEELRKLLIQPHEWQLKSLAELWNAHYHPVYSIDDLDFEPEEGLTLLEIFPDEQQTKAFWDRYVQ